MYYVLNQLDKQCCPLTHIDEPDMLKRATEMMNNSKAMGVADVCDPEDWNKGNVKINTVYVAEVFNTRHGLQQMTQEEIDKFGLIDDDIAGTREERQFRLWINSLEIDGVYVNNLFEDVGDGQIMLKVIHKINPNVVEWNRVEKNANNTFKIGINCKVAEDALRKMKLTLVGVGAEDIQKGQKKGVLAMVWQLMRVHYLQIIGNKSEKDLIAWGNSCKGNENMQIANFKDKNLASGVYLVNLCAAIEPRAIDWDLVNTSPDADDEAKGLNAKYAISIARKLGGVVFMVWEDVLECNQKMMTIFFSTVYELHQESKGKQ